MQTLLSVEGIDVNAVNRSGETAFAIAEKMNNEELVNILKEAGGVIQKSQYILQIQQSNLNKQSVISDMMSSPRSNKHDRPRCKSIRSRRDSKSSILVG